MTAATRPRGPPRMLLGSRQWLMVPGRGGQQQQQQRQQQLRRRRGYLCSAGRQRGMADLSAARCAAAAELEKLPEVIERRRFGEQLRRGTCAPPPSGGRTLQDAGMGGAEALQALDAAFLTCLLHAESRVASALGQGFYTIGPCGEELLSAVGVALRPGEDCTALHYRHLATQLARQLRAGRGLEELALDRARGHVVSSLDPVTGGVHCSIGGGPTDFLVTSTLASQCPAAVGRALGAGLASRLGLPAAQRPLAREGVSFALFRDAGCSTVPRGADAPRLHDFR
jgi:hypothetical protein